MPSVRVSPSEHNCSHEDDAEGNASKLQSTIQVHEGTFVFGSSTNVLLLYHLNDLKLLYWVTMVLSILCLVFIGMQLVLLAIASDWDYMLTIHPIFHYAEFWSAFAYSVVDVVTLMIAAKGANTFYWKPLTLKLLPAASLIMAFVPAVLISFDLKRFGFQAHNIEYTGLVCLTCIDSVLWMSSIVKYGATKTKILMLSLVILAMLSGITQLVIWNTMLNATGRQVAHLLEFIFNVVDASTTFWFITDTRLEYGNAITSILQAPPDSLKVE